MSIRKYIKAAKSSFNMEKNLSRIDPKRQERENERLKRLEADTLAKKAAVAKINRKRKLEADNRKASSALSDARFGGLKKLGKKLGANVRTSLSEQKKTSNPLFDDKGKGPFDDMKGPFDEPKKTKKSKKKRPGITIRIER